MSRPKTDLVAEIQKTYAVTRGGVAVPWENLARMSGTSFTRECKLYLRANAEMAGHDVELPLRVSSGFLEHPQGVVVYRLAGLKADELLTSMYCDLIGPP